MKKRFIINFLLILVTAFAAVAAARSGIWFSASGAALLCLFIIYREFKLFDECADALKDEKFYTHLVAKKTAETETELHFYKMVMEGVDTAVIMATDGGCVEWMNSAARLVLGNEELLPAVIMDGIKNRSSEVILAGKEYSLECSRLSLRFSDRNIVVLKNIHSSIERSKVESWHKLVRVLTHEIMNSMTPIISLSETLCESAKNDALSAGGDDSMENIRRGLEIIKRRSSGLLSFVENYRKLTRIAAPDKKLFALKGLLDDLRELFSNPYIKFESSAVEGVELLADRTQIEQVLINLLKNSVEACEERSNSAGDYDKRITFAADVVSASGSRCVEFSVTDNGIGILSSVREQLFVPFFTTKKSGSGIGLSLCKQIITNHGGSIEIESDENGGCTVKCSLPMYS